MKNSLKLQTALGALTVLLALFPLLAHMDANDNHLNYANHNYGKNLMNTLEPHSVFMTEGGDNQVFTSAYNQMAQLLRPDVRIYDQKGNVFYRIYGDFRYMSQQEVDIKRDIVDFEIFSRGRPVYLTWRRTPTVAACGDFFLKRYGILFKVVPLKYQILEELEADREMPLAQALRLIEGYYAGQSLIDKLQANRKALEWYLPSVLGTGAQRPHFITNEQPRMERAVREYKAFVDNALSRTVDGQFCRGILAGLEREGYLRVEGNTVVFIRDIPAPFSGNYWDRYIFDYKKVRNAVSWDYLTREILTNYNFYFAEYAREMITKLGRQKAYYQRKAAQGGETAVIRGELDRIAREIADYAKLETGSYAEAARFGFDMAAIHHNLGSIYLQRGDLATAVDSFRRGVEADKYSYPTIYSYILLRLRQAAESGKPADEAAALTETAEICRQVYRRLKATYSLDEEGMKTDQTVQQFKRFEQSVIETRKKFTLEQAVALQSQVALAPANIDLQAQLVSFLYQRQDTEGILKAFRNAPEAKWGNVLLVYYYGIAQQQGGDLDDSIATFERLQREHPVFFLGSYRLAQMYDQLKHDPQRALPAYRAVLAVSKAAAQAQYSAYIQIFDEMQRMSRQRIGELEARNGK